MSDVLYINGRFTTTDEKVIAVEDRGFQFGDGVYEAIKFLAKRLLFSSSHFRRLSVGLDALEIPSPWSEESFAAITRELLERTTFGEGIVYIQVTRGEAERVHFYPENIAPTTVAYSRRFAFPDAMRKEMGIRVITTEDIRWKYCNVKSLNLLGNVLAKKKAQRAGASEALFVEQGQVTEGASSSFFVVQENRLITHPVDLGILPGTVRDRVISLAIGEEIRVDERPIRENELCTVDEAFITSTTQGVMPVNEIDGRIIGNRRRGEITSILQRRFEDLELRESGAGLPASSGSVRD